MNGRGGRGLLLAIARGLALEGGEHLAGLFGTLLDDLLSKCQNPQLDQRTALVPNRTGVTTLIPLFTVLEANQDVRVFLDELQGVFHELRVGLCIFQLTKRMPKKENEKGKYFFEMEEKEGHLGLEDRKGEEDSRLQVQETRLLLVGFPGLVSLPFRIGGCAFQRIGRGREEVAGARGRFNLLQNRKKENHEHFPGFLELSFVFGSDLAGFRRRFLLVTAAGAWRVSFVVGAIVAVGLLCDNFGLILRLGLLFPLRLALTVTISVSVSVFLTVTIAVTVTITVLVTITVTVHFSDFTLYPHVEALLRLL